MGISRFAAAAVTRCSPASTALAVEMRTRTRYYSFDASDADMVWDVDAAAETTDTAAATAAAERKKTRYLSMSLYRRFIVATKAFCDHVARSEKPLYRPGKWKGRRRWEVETGLRSFRMSLFMLQVCKSEFRRPLAHSNCPEELKKRFAEAASTLALVRRTLELGPESTEYQFFLMLLRSANSNASKERLPKKPRETRELCIEAFELDVRDIAARLGVKLHTVPYHPATPPPRPVLRTYYSPTTTPALTHTMN